MCEEGGERGELDTDELCNPKERGELDTDELYIIKSLSIECG